MRCLTVRCVKLDEWVAAGKQAQVRGATSAVSLAFYELAPTGREVTLYWRGLPPKATVSLAMDMRADVPGSVRSSHWELMIDVPRSTMTKAGVLDPCLTLLFAVRCKSFSCISLLLPGSQGMGVTSACRHQGVW